MLFGLESGMEPNIVSRIVPFLILGISLFCVYKFKKNIREWKHEKVFRYTWMTFAVLLELWFWRWTYVYLSKGDMYHFMFNRTMLPLHLCAMALWVSIIVGITLNRRVFIFGFFIGILGPVITLVAGEVSYSFDHLRYWHFYLLHISTLVFVIYLYFVHELKIYKGEWIGNMKIMIGLSFILLPINYLTGSNFMYLYNGYDSPLDGMHWVLGYVILFACTAVIFKLIDLVAAKEHA